MTEDWNHRVVLCHMADDSKLDSAGLITLNACMQPLQVGWLSKYHSSLGTLNPQD